MLRTYILIAIRNIRRNKVYALLNVLGLTVGIAACMLLFVVVRFNQSFDDFHANRENIYRIGSEFHNDGTVDYSAGSSFPTAKAIRLDFPQIKKVAAIYSWGDGIISDVGEQRKKFNENNIYFAEAAFFELFNFPWLTGDPKQSLTQPNNVALSQEIAEKYFGDYKSALGKTIRFDNKYVYKVAGIIKNSPANSDFPLNVVISYPSMHETNLVRNEEDWVSTFSGSHVYVVLPEKYTKAQFDKDLVTFTKKHRPADYAKDVFVSQPLSTIHTDDRFGNFNRDRTFSSQLALSLTLIGLFLIAIACVNFINLATAQAVNRSREVGVRKVLGSNRLQLALQFLAETAIITVVAMVAATGLASLVLPLLNRMLEVNMSMELLQDWKWLITMLTGGILVVLLSGLYPAMIISGFNPITALKNKITARMVGGLSLRRVLVVLQFAIAHVLIIGTLVIVAQTNYFRRASLGFDKSSIMRVPVPGDSASQLRYDYIKSALMQNSGVEQVSFSFASPADNGGWSSDFKFDHSAKVTTFGASLKWADADYFKTYHLNFIAGKPYSQTDTVRGLVVNETLIKKFGITDPQKALGKQIDFWDGRVVSEIVGVVSDFNSNSLRDPIVPVILGSWKDVYQIFSVRVKTGQESQVLAAVEKIWNESFPQSVYEYQFLDKRIDAFYRQENQLAKLYKIFAGLAIFISCLGLYGLVSFMAVQRLREVGIRKVLGASVSSIVYLFSKELTLLILIAFVISAPVAWYFMNNWLQDFTYRINLGAGVFLLAIAASLVIAWLAVGYRSLRAALVNPVKSLRSE